MQAEEKLSFIKPFVAERLIDDKEKEQLAAAFLNLCLEILNRIPESVRSKEIIEDSGFVTVVEGSYKVDSLDGSYVHVVVFGHVDGDRLLDIGLSIVEHTNEGIPQNGYVYDLQGDDLRRDTVYPDVDDPKGISHFSLIELYEANDFMEMAINGPENEDLREEASQIKAKIQQDLLFSGLEKEMGIDQQPPRIDELLKLQTLLLDVQPFVAPTEDDDDIYR